MICSELAYVLEAGGWKDLKTFIVNLWGEISS